MFITFEGGEGSGKTTQARALAIALEREGHAVWTTREPGGTPLAEVLRQVVLHPGETVEALRLARGLPSGDPLPEAITPEAELLLMNAARAQHVAEIRRRLALGQIVISDRFADATLAYQGGGREMPLQQVRAVTDIATAGLTPDLTALLDCDPRAGLRRKLHGQRNRLDDEDLAFHDRVRATYLALAEAEPARWIVLPALGDVDELAARILAEVQTRL
jgi:dTMP kinase